MCVLQSVTLVSYNLAKTFSEHFTEINANNVEMMNECHSSSKDPEDQHHTEPGL